MLYYPAQRAAIYHRLSYYADTVSEFTSDCIFFFLNTRVRSSLVYLIYFNREKKGELN